MSDELFPIYPFRSTLERLKILYVEDDDRVRTAIKELLLDEGHIVLAFSDPSEAQPVVERIDWDIDVVITDLCFDYTPHCDVEEFLMVCMENEGMGLVLFTGATKLGLTPEEQERFLVVEKPANREELLSALNLSIEKARQNSEQYHVSNVRVLLVDDNEDLRCIYTSALSAYGWKVRECSYPSEACEMLKTETFDVIVTDLRFDFTPSDEVYAFLKTALATGASLAICTAAGWEAVPYVQGIPVIRKGDHKLFLCALRKLARRKMCAPAVSDEVLHRLANPEWHTNSPMLKWERRVILDPHASVQDMQQLYLEYLHRELNDAGRRGGEPSKRELNDLMDKLLRLRRKLR